MLYTVGDKIKSIRANPNLAFETIPDIHIAS